MEELQVRHRKEQKDLQGRITQKKKNATKKTRKGVNDECERLEQQLKERQKSELDALDGTSVDQELDKLQIDDPNNITNGDVSKESDDNDDVPVDPAKSVSFAQSTKQEDQDEPQAPKKPNRQKARMARKAAEQESQIAAAKEEAANIKDVRQEELMAMEEQKKKIGLKETFIRPDGHCLFSACAEGLPADVVKKSGPYSKGYQNIRYVAADFMTKHRDDFEAFLEEPFDSYVKKIKDTAEWGGQLELQAISRSFNVTINVLQANGRVDKIEPGQEASQNDDLWLAYYKHSFGLGEHYNALRKA